MKLSTLFAGVLALCGVVTVRLQAQQPIDSFPPVVSRPEVEVQALTINSTTEDDFAPVVLRGGDLLIFTSSRSGPFGPSGTQRIWSSSRQPAGWTTPASTSEALTHAEQSGAATLTPDGNFMIFAAYEWSDKTMAVSGRTDLFSAERVRGEWSNIQNLGPIVNSPDWDSQPSLSVDGRTLYFASDRPGGSGRADIYVTHHTASGWSAPVNLGPAVNTPEDDLSPSIAPDGKSLFFASKGHGGAGGFDLFIAKGGNELGTGWGSIENLGTPINSAANDYFFSSIPNSKNSMFSSDRSGNLDIYTAYPNPYPPEALVTVSGHVLEHGSNQPIAASITVTDLSSGEVVANYTTDDRTGDYFVVLARGHRYSITAEAPDHIFYSDEYAIPPNTAAQDLKKDILLYRTSGGNTRLLVFFDFDQAELKTESKPDLNRAIAFLRQNPTINVEIAGYTDSVGTVEYNTKLSQDRANAVRTYLISGGIDQNRLKAVGYGEDQPVADNATEEGRARNRRVEMRVR
jgi:outer membrane protein OmpA-like peptidoglycan-associated protein